VQASTSVDRISTPVASTKERTAVTTPQEFIASALMRERNRAGLTISELARKAAVGKSTLSQLEAGSGNPSLETLWSLATALGIPFWRLVEPVTDTVTVIRVGEGRGIEAAESKYIGTLLSASPKSVCRDIYRISAEPGPPRKSTPHAAGTVEHVILVAGQALVGPIDSPTTLNPGDYMSYRGDAPHIFEALEAGTIATLISESLL
jgi:transcriptional regulator with XRE-family HTH domain